uniref:L-gulonolactone oxidase n=1 Tax=Candidatus Kentrum sp. FM TaxID=2126340 RepID=A0A450SZT2_9GAMM|nr:MAG: L-gulonolactone oxidase [Candidatus Kentron sp. FM]VFJ60241.1 MAG: L-gulonolactone oxidase [Candidatus Kentron sp. FM]VFK12466.1 MAG: L-gulonolactone oxidase [Candidatus Kentron sp. FM]
MDKNTFYNWSEQFHCTPKQVHRPRSEAQVMEVMTDISHRGAHVRVFGSGLSPSDIAMSDEDLVLLTNLDGVLDIDADTATVVVQPGITLEKLSHELAAHGLALPVLGSVAGQTVSGAAGTGTHGTGVRFGTFPSQVRALRMVTPGGGVLKISLRENPGLLDAARCHLGSLGIITEMTLQVCKAFDLAVTERPNTLEAVLEGLPERLRTDHYRFWYVPHTDRVWEWMATRTPPADSHPSPGPWRKLATRFNQTVIDHHVYESLLHLATYRPSLIPVINRLGARARFNKARQSKGPGLSQFTIDCLFKQHVNEWSIPLEHTAEALRGIRELIARKGYYAHLPIEVRFVRGDDTWLSPCQGRDSCYIGVIAYLPHGRPPHHEAYFADFEELMGTLSGRPHWGKFFRLEPERLAERYPRWEDFQRVRRHLDPDYRLRNTFTERVFAP